MPKVVKLAGLGERMERGETRRHNLAKKWCARWAKARDEEFKKAKVSKREREAAAKKKGWMPVDSVHLVIKCAEVPAVILFPGAEGGRLMSLLAGFPEEFPALWIWARGNMLGRRHTNADRARAALVLCSAERPGISVLAKDIANRAEVNLATAAKVLTEAQQRDPAAETRLKIVLDKQKHKTSR